MRKKFIRQENTRFSKIGKHRKKLQKWRRPKGRDSKMRIRRRGHGPSPTVGHRSPRKISGNLNGLKPVMIHNLQELANVEKGNIAVIAKVGAKKKLEILAEAEKKNIQIFNLGKKQ